MTKHFTFLPTVWSTPVFSCKTPPSHSIASRRGCGPCLLVPTRMASLLTSARVEGRFSSMQLKQSAAPVLAHCCSRCHVFLSSARL